MLKERCKVCPSRSQYCSVFASLFISSWKNNAITGRDVQYDAKWGYLSKHGRPRSHKFCVVSSSKSPIFKWDASCDPPLVIYLPEEYAKGTFESLEVPQMNSSQTPLDVSGPKISISSSIASSSEVAMDPETSGEVLEELRISTSELSEGDDFVIDAIQAESELFDSDPASQTPLDVSGPKISISSSVASSSEVAMDPETSSEVLEELRMSTSELSDGDDFVIDAVQAESELFDSDLASICCFNLQCRCGEKLRYGKNQKAVPCNLGCPSNRKHAWTYHCAKCSSGKKFNVCSFCLLDKGFMSAYNHFNSSTMVKNLSGDSSLGFYQALKPLHCVHIISIVHDIFRELWPAIPINDICCIDMGHGRGQMVMLMGRVFGFALGCDVQKDLARTVVTTLLSEEVYDKLLDNVLLMECDLSRFNSFNGKKYNHIFE